MIEDGKREARGGGERRGRGGGGGQDQYIDAGHLSTGVRVATPRRGSGIAYVCVYAFKLTAAARDTRMYIRRNFGSHQWRLYARCKQSAVVASPGRGRVQRHHGP